jgi:broad specificity phosphatase PhoE
MQNPKKTIYFVRHGQTAGNVAGQTLSSEAPLNEHGHTQAQFVAKRALQLDFGRIISSDYCRAKQTAEAIAGTTGKPLEFSELFREYRRPSEFWGRMSKEDSEVFAGYKAIEKHFFDPDWHYSDEENFFDLKRRGQAALQFLLDHEEEKILVVSHANFLRNLLGLMLRGDTYSPQDYLDIETTFSINNTSITVAYQHYYWRRDITSWTLGSWNDDAHLGSIA